MDGGVGSRGRGRGYRGREMEGLAGRNGRQEEGSGRKGGGVSIFWGEGGGEGTVHARSVNYEDAFFGWG